VCSRADLEVCGKSRSQRDPISVPSSPWGVATAYAIPAHTVL